LGAVALALLVCLPVPSFSAAGKLRFYVDRDNDGAYDAGEAVANGTGVTYIKYNSNTLTWTWTDANGCIDYSGAKKDDKLFCKYLAYAQAAWKGQRGFAGSAFDLYMDSDNVSGDGGVDRRKLTTAEANLVNAGNTVGIRLYHPTVSANLVIAPEFAPTADYLTKLKNGLKSASKYLYDCTDGQCKLGRVDIKGVTLTNVPMWLKDADVRLYADASNQWPQSSVDGVSKNANGDQLDMPSHFDGQKATAGNPDKSEWYRTFIHELGHYFLSFYDEYIDGNANKDAWKTYRKNHHNEVPWNYGLMDYQYDASEMSSNNDYLNSYAGRTAEKMTREIWTYNCSGGGTHRPCWQRFFDRFDNRNGTLGTWGGYGGIRAQISMPPDGRYTGYTDYIFWQVENRTSSDRDGPSSIPTTLGSAVVWDECTFPSFAMSSEPEPNDGPSIGEPAPGGGRDPVGLGGPKLVLSGYMSVSGLNHILRIRLISDVTLLGLPTVKVRPDYGSQINVTMAPAGTNTYEGSVNISTSQEGGVDVAATSSGGTTNTSTKFWIQDQMPAPPPEMNSISGWLDAHLPLGIISAPSHSVTMGSGTAPILPVMDPSLQFLAEPFSFRIQDGVTVGSDFVTNWQLDQVQTTGRDAFTTTVLKFNESAREWQPVTGVGFAPGYRVVSGANLQAGIYGVFMRPSADTTAPGAISNLTAVPGDSDKSVGLAWTAPGDDGSSGTAVRYHVWFNTEPITTGNLGDCKELAMPIAPQAAGTSEHFAFQMPEADKLYYFVVQAQDEAENLGPISSWASTTSYATDTDSDGMPDYWETAYGLDPNNPADASLDNDNDGLTNLQEYQNGTNPLDPDTDADGVKDGLEVSRGTDPLDPTDPDFQSDTDADGLSNGLEILAGTDPFNAADPLQGTACAMKLLPTGTKVGNGGLVCTGSFAGFCYGEDQDATCGIRLEGWSALAGKRIEVIGTVATNPNGERCLQGCVAHEWEDCSVRIVPGMTNRSVGGGGWFYSPGPGTGQRGITDAYGLNNIGMLIRTWGQVTEIHTSPPPRWFKIDDGSNCVVKVVLPDSWQGDLPGQWEYVSVTGVSSCEADGPNLNRVILIRSEEDIVEHPQQ